MLLYRSLSLLLAAICLASAVFCGKVLPKHSGWALKFPRWRIPGTVLGAILLSYCAYAGGALLPGSRWGAFFWALVPVTVCLSYFYLDFLMARAYGGLLIILSNYAIQHAFAYHCACRPLYALAALVWGVAGIVILAWPWCLRDILVRCGVSARCRQVIWAVCIVTAVLLAALPFAG